MAAGSRGRAVSFKRSLKSIAAVPILSIQSVSPGGLYSEETECERVGVRAAEFRDKKNWTKVRLMVEKCKLSG